MKKPGEKELRAAVAFLAGMIILIGFVEIAFAGTDRINDIHEDYNWMIIFFYLFTINPVLRVVSKYLVKGVFQTVVILLHVFPAMMIIMYIIRLMFYPVIISFPITAISLYFHYEKSYEKFRVQK